LGNRARHHVERRSFRPRLECLEDRLTPSTLTVTNPLNDGSSGTLRAAIAAAGSGDTINFDAGLSGSTIPGAGLVLNKDLNIVGLGAANLALSAGSLGRVFEIDAGATVAISGLTIENGFTYGPGGGIWNLGTLRLSDCTLSGNRSNFIGGGIANSGTLAVSDCILSDNSATFGGGIYNDHFTLSVSGSTLSGNSATFGGGIYNDNGTLSVSAGTNISGNAATYFGGGIYNRDYQLSVTDSTICGNLAPQGGDLYDINGTFTLTNSDVCDIAVEADTFTTLTPSSSISVLGQAVTYTATVVAFAPGTPTGTVTFWDGSTPLGTVALDGSGRASLTTTGLSVGLHAITAIYSGGTSGNTTFVSSGTFSPFYQTVIDADQELNVIADQVYGLIYSGMLSSGNGNALLVKLNNAIASLNKDNTSAGVAQMNAFINEAQAFLKAGKLDSIDEQALIADAGLAITAALDAGP
jgi:hypothetical protein